MEELGLERRLKKIIDYNLELTQTLKKRYNCPKHGNIGRATLELGNIQGIWCLNCLVEKLEASGVCRVELIESAEDDKKLS